MQTVEAMKYAIEPDEKMETEEETAAWDDRVSEQDIEDCPSTEELEARNEEEHD